MTLQEKSLKLVQLREAIGEFDKEYEEKVKPLKEQKDVLQSEIMDELKNSGQFSARFDFGTITRAVRKTLQVVDENKVVKWLKKKKLAKEYVSVRPNELFFSSMLKEAVKQDLKIDGTELKETEYISVSQPSAKEDKRKITTDEYAKK